MGGGVNWTEDGGEAGGDRIQAKSDWDHCQGVSSVQWAQRHLGGNRMGMTTAPTVMTVKQFVLEEINRMLAKEGRNVRIVAERPKPQLAASDGQVVALNENR